MLNYIKTFKCGDTAERRFIADVEKGNHGHVLSVLVNHESETLYYQVEYECQNSIRDDLNELYANELDCVDTGKKRELTGYFDEEKRLSRFQVGDK